MSHVEEKKIPNTLFLSTYPPRACGIATFTQDLIHALETECGCTPGVVAINDGEYEYPPEVQMKLDQYDPNSYLEIAQQINTSGAELLMIEHEFGIYGGRCGEYLLKLTKLLEIPYLLTLHTVLPKPKKLQHTILTKLAEGSRKIITMSNSSVEILKDVYGMDPEKIAVIPHGVPEIAVEDREQLKKEIGVDGRFVVSTFGLLSPGKGLEYGIGAVARVAKKHPEILYLILGQTHPVIKEKYGEQYREKLEAQVADLGIQDNVRFVNRYLTKEEIVLYLDVSDAYMTPYLGKDQAVSGTLAYAAGYGRVIISTPYPYAKEMLADGRGLLAKFRSTVSLEKCILQIMRDPKLKEKMERNTLKLGQNMMWSKVAEDYRSVFLDAISCEEGARNG
jgi:glycosyltransferase involved in cell wall biosynthesis